ncbi:hypothetical protein EI555_004503, partial [Monodon monoceros]
MELEVLEICPYDPNHRIKIQRKLKKMANCKYNACHVVLIKRLKEHEANSVNRTAIDDDKFFIWGTDKWSRVTSPSLEPSEKFSDAANQIPDPDVWNVDNTHHSPSFVLKTFAPKMLVCESDSRDIKKETMDDKHPNNHKSWRK